MLFYIIMGFYLKVMSLVFRGLLSYHVVTSILISSLKLSKVETGQYLYDESLENIRHCNLARTAGVMHIGLELEFIES